ncbi:hypothetical protein A2U01_0074024, partial [Trifolium medium]|nr:hypothetical protein [Trifolium medium]
MGALEQDEGFLPEIIF